MTAHLSRRTVRVDAGRLDAWLHGFAVRHGELQVVATENGFDVTAADGATAEVTLPFPTASASPDAEARRHSGDVVHDAIVDTLRPRRVLVVVVRRGGYLCAVVQGSAVVASKLGHRRVQGRTAAGGWSQQRYARRRQKQTDELLDAVVTWTERLRVATGTPEVVVPGGDRALAGKVLADPRLATLAGAPRAPHLDVGDPDRALVTALPTLVTRVAVRVAEPAS